MMCDWEIIDTGKADAEVNMELDSQLLDSFAAGHQRPILHLYDWVAPSATYGYFIDPYQYLNAEALRSAGVQLAKRPTGGGIIFHVSDLAFSMLIPANHSGYSVNILDNYAFVNRLVIRAIDQFIDSESTLNLLPLDPLPIDSHARHFCMAKPTKYDVMLNGRKVGGGAQRRTRHGFLHQGTISLSFPDEAWLKRLLLPGTCVLEAMRMHTSTLMSGKPAQNEIEVFRQRFRRVLTKAIRANEN